MLELKFTETYRKWENGPKPLRELECLKVQFPAILQPVRDTDLLAGIAAYGAIGFSPKDDEEFAWYMRPKAMEELIQAHPECRSELEEARDYWKGRKLKAATRASYSELVAGRLPSDDLDDVYPAYPLYRMTGCIVDYHKLLNLGLPGLLDESRVRLETEESEEKRFFYEGQIGAVNLLKDCLLFYEADCLKQAKRRDAGRAAELEEMADNLRFLTENAPETFWQAAQLAWLYSIVAHTLDYGRMDDYLGPFLKRDLETGRIELPFAQRIVDSLWLLIADKRTTVHGRVVIGGRGRKEESAADLFSLCALEASRRVRRGEPQLSLRCYRGMNRSVFRKALKLLGEGTTFPILYNDEENIPAVERALKVSGEEAQEYYPFGCGEYVIAGKSFGSPNGVINLARVLELTLQEGDWADFESLYREYLEKIRWYVEALAAQEAQEYRAAGEAADFLLLSLLYDDCTARGKGLFSGGIRYLGGTLECYGNITASDSLTALNRLVYQEENISLKELKAALQKDFNGQEELRKRLLEVPKFGNHDPAADGMAHRLHWDLCRMIAGEGKKNGLYTYLPVLINNDHNVRFGRTTGATPDGRKAGRPLTNGNSPADGADKNGLTALLLSMASMDHKLTAGIVQNVKLGKTLFSTEEMLKKTAALIGAYFQAGGSQLMITVVSARELKDAQLHPENYQNLFVRVGGYSGRFISLPKEVQEDIIERTLYE